MAKTFREKKLPCDALIYLGTEFTPSGWNTRNGEFSWKTENFPDPKKAIDDLHALHYKVVLHSVIEGRRMSGTVAGAVHAGQGGAERTHRRRSLAGGPRGRMLLAVSQAGDGSRRRRLVAGSGRRPRRAVAAGADPDVLGRAAALPAERAAVRAAPERLRRHAALRRVPLVGRRLLDLGDAEDARAGRRQHRPLGHSVLGHRHRRLRADARVHRRAPRALVPVRHLLPVVPLARPDLASAAAVGLEHRRARTRRSCAATPAAPAIPTRASCGTRRSSRSSASISSCAIGCCPTPTPSPGSAATPACR